MRGWALSEQGVTETGLDQMRQDLSAIHSVNPELRQPYYLA